ncbi:MAG: glycosyltransferase, partial [Clostridia bacterium]|nr:glycosyltransferase [Clostridia bacterium]
MYIAYITVGAVGHVMPTLPFISELVRRGVRVRYFTTRHMEETIAFTGAEFCPVDTVLTKDGAAREDIQVDFMAELPLRFLSEADCVIRQVLPVLEKDRPDLIVSDATAVAGRLAAAALKLPLVQVFTSYASNDVFSVASGFPPVPDTHPARMKARALSERFSALYGVKSIGLKEIFEWRGDLNIVTLLKEFQPAGESF